MKISKRSVVWLRIACTLLVLFLLNEVAQAKLIPRRDPRAGVLESSLVVLVKQFQKDLFQVDEIFFGEANAGDLINLPDFRLFTYQNYGPDIVEPITSDTRILLFLKHKGKYSTDWEVTADGYCFFWTHDPNKVDELQKMARDSVALRKSWEAARDLADEKTRIAALWPYLWSNDRYFSDVTKKELQKMGTVAGDHIAAQFHSLTREQRFTFLRDAGKYGGEPLHAILIEHLKQQRKLYNKFLAEHGPKASAIVEEWQNAPEEIIDIYVEMVRTLEGLVIYADKNDLPLVRELAVWGVKYRIVGLCEVALVAFRGMPERGNLPIINAIWKEFLARQWQGRERTSHSVIEALQAHPYPEAVPLLAGFLNDRFDSDTAHDVLTEIAGKDLGKSPKAWLDWYKMQQAQK